MASPFGLAVPMRPEVELLLLSARVGGSADEARKTQALLQANIDWAFLSRAAYDHAVLPLLYQHLRTTFPEEVPEEALKQLRDESIHNTSSSLALTGVLFKLLDLFDAHDIHAIPYKGPALAASAYGDVALRQFVDLDFIVRKRDVLKVKDLLIARGWHTEFELTEAQEAAFLDHSYDYEFRKQGMLVEVHWELTERFYSFPLDVERLWDRLVPVTMAGRQVMTLSPEDSLLIVCVHASKHLWSRLGWVCDVARLIETNREMNWTLLMKHASTLGSKRMLLLGLKLASELLGASLPDEVARDLHRDSGVTALAANVAKRLFDDKANCPSMLAVSILHLKMRERLRDRARYCLRFALATTVGDLTSLRIPRSLFFLYYPLRPFRLAGKYGRRLISRIFSGEREKQD